MDRLKWVRDVRESAIVIRSLTDEDKRVLIARASKLLRNEHRGSDIDEIVVLPINDLVTTVNRFHDIKEPLQNLDTLVLELYDGALRDICNGEINLATFRNNFNKELTAVCMVRVRDAFRAFGWPARHAREKTRHDEVLLDLISRVERVYHALTYLSVGFALHADGRPIRNIFTKDAEAGFFPNCLPVGIYDNHALVVLAAEQPSIPSQPPKVLEFI